MAKILPSKGLESGVCGINLGTNANKTHQCVTVIARKILVRVTLVKAFQCKSHKLELAEEEIALVMVDELQISKSLSIQA